MKDKCHTVISTHAEKAFDKIQYPFMVKKKKPLNKVDMDGMYLNMINMTYTAPCVYNIIINGGKLKAFPLRSGARHRCPLLPL